MKIAIIGTGAGAKRAPYHDESWELWSLCGIYNIQQEVKRKFNRIYEVHSAKHLTEMRIDVAKGQWMAENVTHIHPTLKASFPNAAVIDFESHIEKHGPYFTSSLAWMLADAIAEKPKEIYIYGVTMSADGEYAHQKPSCSYLIGWARANGIKVTIDKGSELMSAPWIYGYEDVPDIVQSLADKKEQLDRELHKAEGESLNQERRVAYLTGAKSQVEWYENNWFSGGKRC